MYKLALLIGLYSYAIFALGILGLLGNLELAIISVAFLLLLLWKAREVGVVRGLQKWLENLGKFDKFLLLLLVVQAVTNLIGALGPELSFDALWYHLTLPKIYLIQHKIFHIPGGLLYYSDMPKLVEMLYIPALLFGNEILAKLIHFAFGIGCLFAVYKLSRKFVSEKISLLACVAFYSNLVIAWQSTTAYVDLGRAFFEVLALYYLVDRSYTRSAVMLGLAMSSKLLAISSLLIFLPLVYLSTKSITKSFKYGIYSLLVPLPWFIFSYLNTGNPFYPFLSKTIEITYHVSITNLINFIRSSDPISPIYLIAAPLVFIYFRRMSKDGLSIIYYSLFALLVWFMTPQIGGGRFLAAYLPAFSISLALIVFHIKNKLLQNYVIGLILFVGIVSVLYRGAANAKYIPVVLGFESKDHFLSKNLNFDFGDFYDVDHYFERNIRVDDRVLIYGTHNLLYVNFPFIHESWAKPGDKFNYVMTQGVELPKRFSDWDEVYSNKTTNVKLYREPRQ